MEREFDPRRNKEILRQRLYAYNKKSGPRVGDYVVLKNKKTTRFTHDWGNQIQIGDRDKGGVNGSFYLGKGYVSYSGSLDSPIKKKNIVPTKRKKTGSLWFFDNDMWGADRGVNKTAKFRVFRER